MQEFIDVQQKLSRSEDAAEGVRSFVERRAARFSGR
jgi:enoyl-CoA hydratase/carnithine racemase